jgi:integrase
MASFIKRVSPLTGKTSYRARVRSKTYSNLSATFPRLHEAKKWAASVETSIQQGKYFKHAESKRLTLCDVIPGYSEEGMEHLKDRHTRIKHLVYWETKIGHVYLADIRPVLILQYRSELKRSRSNSTANRYVATLSALLSYAVKELQLLETNPVLNIKKLKEPPGRTRILDDEERINLIQACKDCKTYPEMLPIVLLGITTGMRRGEILNLRWADVNFKTERIVLWRTKNGETRTVPLVGPALIALRAWAKIRPIDNTAYIFPSRVEGNSSNVFHLDHAWRLVKNAAGLTNFRFHDLRHTAASYLVMNGAGLREIGDILGHKTLAMVQRYSHLTDDHKHSTVTRMSNAIFGEINEQGI